MLREVLLGGTVLMYIWCVGLPAAIDLEILSHGQPGLREAIGDGCLEKFRIEETRQIISAGNIISTGEVLNAIEYVVVGLAIRMLGAVHRGIRGRIHGKGRFYENLEKPGHVPGRWRMAE